MKQKLGHQGARPRRQLLAVAVAACFAGPVLALPTAPTVVNGSATFAADGSKLTVTNSNGAIINWQSFNIWKGETTHFQQTSASSRVLNQVVGAPGSPATMSQIYGTLSSNGQVWLVNTAGIVVGAGGIVDTAGFVASTLPIRVEDFLANKLNFQPFPGAGDVINQGTIKTSSGGSVYLVGSNVSNEGVITTPGGETILAAGATVSLYDTATPGVKVDITGATGTATNLGSIVAEAGRIGLAGAIVRNSGTLDASSVVNEGGRIFLKASQDTYVDGKGRIVATGTKGGRVEVLGERVTVTDNALIDASGTNGGGTILVGGDYQGKNPEVQNAYTSYFGPNATLRANATGSGSGGKVIIWADDTARAYGTIEAKGAGGGKGGFVETSGQKFLEINGIRVNTAGGTWLIDPGSICVYGGAPGSCGGGFGFYWTDTDLSLALLSNNVVLQTDSTGSGDIRFYNANVNNTAAPAAYGLGVYAYGGAAGSMGNIFIENSVLNIKGDVTMIAGWNGGSASAAGTYVAGKGQLMIGQGGGLDPYSNIVYPYVSGSILSGGNVVLKAGTNIGIDYVKGVNVTVQAQHSIWDNNWQSWGAPNIDASGTINLTSMQGWNWSNCYYQDCSAISLDVAGPTTHIMANVAAGSYGGVDIRYNGNATMEVDLIDASSNQNYNYVEFEVAGDVALAAGSIFSTAGGGIWIGSGGNMTTANMSFSGTPSEIGLGANNTLTVASPISVTNTTGAYYPSIWLMAGSQLNVNANLVSAGDIYLGAGITESALESIEGNPDPGSVVGMLGGLGGTVNINALVDANDSVGFVGGNVNINGSGRIIAGYGIYGFAAGDIALTNGGFMEAGYDVFLALAGSNSTLYLNKDAISSPAYILADAAGSPGSIYLDFLGRSSGGVVIDGTPTTTSTPGGSGLFVLNHSTPATPGAGLNIYYAIASNAVTAAVTNAINNTTQTKTEIISAAPVLQTTTTPVTDTSQPTSGGGEGEFGGNDKAENGDKKSDNAKSEADDKKQAKKKVAQCKG